MDCVFKIRNKNGLFSNGNVRSFKWTKNGVIFKSKIQLSAHLRAMLEANTLTVYHGCNLLSYSLEMSTDIDMNDMIDELLMKKCIETLKE